jgi:hypothetical protein
MALLRWFRFLDAIEVPWDQATRVEARDFKRGAGRQPEASPSSPRYRPESLNVLFGTDR